jgi:hypothetical protein
MYRLNTGMFAGRLSIADLRILSANAEITLLVSEKLTLQSELISCCPATIAPMMKKC